MMVCMRLVVVAMCWAVVGADPHCDLTNISISMGIEECGNCITINTTSCTGWCFSEYPMHRNSMSPYFQHTCNFKEVTYESVTLPDCPEGVDPNFTYPVALSCECNQCNTDTTECGKVNVVSGCLRH
ncbi:follitropin subunit beta [Scleropages formosus]|nr:follitropin subunit beta [Scleropages formosus]